MMNHNWNTEDIIEHFTLLPPEISFFGSNDPHNHLGKALLLKFFQKEGRFPDTWPHESGSSSPIVQN